VRVACAFDHAGQPLRETVVELLRETGHEVLDLGTDSSVPVDYPDKALDVARAVLSGSADRGILACGSGAGVAIAASKVPGIRAACAHDTYTAHQGVEHDDVNVLCLGARVIGPALAGDIVRAFLAASFSGEERHRRRLGKIEAIERAAGLGEQ
jgi:ribose 5-phosphate isomerase B